jgi:hypothetical protein
MKKIFLKFNLVFVAIVFSSIVFTSCTEDELPAATRLFRPIIGDDNIEVGLDKDTVPYLKLTWDKYADANQYTVTLLATDGKDSVSITTDTVTYTFNNLKFDTDYNIKIHSVNTNTGLKSKDFITTTRTPDFPTQLSTISSGNIIDTQVRVSWAPYINSAGQPTVYDSIKVFNTATEALEVASAVTSEELANASKIIRKLQPKTEYRVEAYFNGKYKGKKVFTTAAPESYDGLVIDLRGLTQDQSYKYFSTLTGSLYKNTVDSIVKANPNQNVTFILQGGVTYRLATISIPATTGTVRFVTGLSLNGNALFAVSGNITTESNYTIGGVYFKKIFFTDAPLEGKKRTDSNYAGTYIFNTISTTASYEIKKISFADCIIKYKRGIVRMQSAGIIDTVSINNCIIDSIGGYGVTNADNVEAKLYNITISNSTLSNCEKLLVNTSSTAYSVNSVNINNSTFVYCGTDKLYYLDFNGCKVTNGINLNNCLFARPGTMKLGTLANGVYGWRGLTSPNFSTCYLTTDFKAVVGTDGVTPVNPITGTTLTTDTPGSFEAPNMSNFKIISSELKKLKVGDLRWY